ncbi:MAG: hypothetical protein KA010_01145, partial [Saprospiraceae bacterium]|nr:hypothetical protein [Saprospiraceae bacterium]
DTLYGNEWINYSQQYYKIKVDKDGIYRISGEALAQAQIPIASIPSNQWQLFKNGKEVPIFVSTSSNLTATDFIEFYGEKNRGEIDRYLFSNPETLQLNPYYSMYSDTATYFLTWKNIGTSNIRYNTVLNDLTNLPSKEVYYWDELLSEWHDSYSKHEIDLHGFKISQFTIGEGFARSHNNSSVQNITLNIPHVYNANPELNATLSVRFKPRGYNFHNQALSLNDVVLLEQQSSPALNSLFQMSTTFPISQLLAQNTIKLEGLNNEPQSNEYQYIAYIKTIYSRTFDFDNSPTARINLTQSNNRRYLELNGFNAAAGVVVYDILNNERTITTVENSNVRVAFEAAPTERKLYFSNLSEVSNITNISPVSFIDYSATSYHDKNYIIITHQSLRQDPQNGNQDWVQTYSDYRQSNDGGAYKPIIIDINNLYDQFAYGITYHPLSVKNALQFFKKKWDAPQYVFLIGKGREYQLVRNDEAPQNLIPTYGFPGSDNLLGTPLFSNNMDFALGRLAILDPKDIKIYYDKVLEHEANRSLPQTVADRAWMKKIIHMGGAVEEAGQIRNYLDGMKNIIENNLYGGIVSTHLKTSDDPIQISSSGRIIDEINKGISILTFFGHSGTNAFDFSIDNLGNYTNKGRYPVIYALGCFSGNIHTKFKGIGERFVLEKDKGAIAYFATTGLGYIPVLNSYMSNYYTLLGGAKYGESIGKIHQKNIEQMSIFSTGYGSEGLIQQYTLLGDPAIKLNVNETPDYTVDPSTVKLDPTQLNIELDSFTVNLDVYNIGKNVEDSITLRIIHQLPDGTNGTINETPMIAPALVKNLNIRLPMLGDRAYGSNKLLIKIDSKNDVNELPAPAAELNNDLKDESGINGFKFYVISDDAKPVYPIEFSIVGNPDITFKASTANVFASNRRYVFEIDTTELFNSPILKTTETTSSGGLLTFKPNVNYVNNTVYYWRISPDSISQLSPYSWKGSSFLFLYGVEEGWNQSHYFQYKKDLFTSLDIDTTRTFNFGFTNKEVRVKNQVYPVTDGDNVGLYSDGGYIGGVSPWNYVDEGINVLILDSVSVGPPFINTGGGMFGSISPPNTQYSFAFKTDTPDNRLALMNFLENTIADGDYVTIWSVLRFPESSLHQEEWEADSLLFGKNLYSVIENVYLSQKIRSIKTTGSVPFVIFSKKNRILQRESFASDALGVVDIEYNLPIRATYGNLTSTIIGPATEWKTAINTFTPQVNDFYKVNVSGLRSLQDPSPVILIDSLASVQQLSAIDANTFPYIRLRSFLVDDVTRTPAYLNHWRILYTPAPDVAINPNEKFSFHKDTVDQGEVVSLCYAIRNISTQNMDSLDVKYTITDSDNKTIIYRDTFSLIAKGDTVWASLNIPTDTLRGNYILNIELNPEFTRLEQYHFNNIGQLHFHVLSDRINPVLDVTFDGTHILDGDIVSPKPLIRILLKDENQYLALSDTSLFQIIVRHVDSSYMHHVSLNDPNVTFIPATSAGPNGKNNKAIVEINNEFPYNGEYQLLVQAQDVSGNESGKIDYKVRFEVIKESSLSNMFNYPNPFSTATRFVYTLTGLETPSQFKVQILSVSGKIVKEIDQNEFGPLKAGTHLSDFVWDGTDDFGDRLANGVYLYRVLAKKSNGEDYNLYHTNDTYFKNGFGKLVILR